MKFPLSNLLETFRKHFGLGLLVLLLLFTFRVGAQLLQWFFPVKFLPPFTAWQSGTLPYGVLLVFQILLIGLMTRVQLRMQSARVVPNARTGEVLLSLGSIYFAFMLFRCGAALSFGQGHAFFGSLLPSVFHLVLSTWVILLGLFHHIGAGLSERDKRREKMWKHAVTWLAYPVLIAVILWLHLFLVGQGSGVLASGYLPVALGALCITLLEKFCPQRSEWKPDGEEVQGDVTFMVFVQILLPKALKFLLAVTFLNGLQSRGLSFDGLWPHGLPPLAQAGLMILLADFLRYWLHRASHEWSPKLWSLHAVHHSPKKLYWVNVGRFHPIEKFLQFLCDAAPFILLGVSVDVLAIYFVFYAVNGFIQHCNIELRLGFLNYLISGPELHRWHHSWEIRESNKNYGNNVIIWDLLFGSYFLPREREVGKLGLKNRAYPRGFFQQMRTPFIKGKDKDHS